VLPLPADQSCVHLLFRFWNRPRFGPRRNRPLRPEESPAWARGIAPRNRPRFGLSPALSSKPRLGSPAAAPHRSPALSQLLSHCLGRAALHVLQALTLACSAAGRGGAHSFLGWWLGWSTAVVVVVVVVVGGWLGRGGIGPGGLLACGERLVHLLQQRPAAFGPWPPSSRPPRQQPAGVCPVLRASLPVRTCHFVVWTRAAKTRTAVSGTQWHFAHVYYAKNQRGDLILQVRVGIGHDGSCSCRGTRACACRRRARRHGPCRRFLPKGSNTG
jgi:hypothetical protein